MCEILNHQLDGLTSGACFQLGVQKKEISGLVD